MRPVAPPGRGANPVSNERIRRSRRQSDRSHQLFVYPHALVDEDIDGSEVDGVGVVVRKRLGPGRLRVRLRSVVPVIVVVMVTSGAVMVVSVVMAGRSRVRVDVRSEVVSGGRAPSVRVGERCRLGK